MSEIVYTETMQQRGGIDSMEYGRKPADKKWTLFQSRDKVALVTSYLVVGVPKPNSDKRYYYWRSAYSLGFRRNKSGTVIPYQCQRPWDSKYKDPWRHQQARLPFDMLTDIAKGDWGAQLVEEFRRAVWFTFDVEKMSDIFPMVDKVGLEHYWTIPHNLHAAFRQNTWEDYTATAFGKTRVTPRLVAAVKDAEPYYVAYARNFRGLVDNDMIVQFLEKNEFDDAMEDGFRPHTPEFRAGLLGAEQRTRDALIAQRLDLNDMGKIQNLTGVHKRYMKNAFRKGYNNSVPMNWQEVSAW